MNKRFSIRIPARILLWLGGAVCGIGLQNRQSWAITVAFVATLCALLALVHCDENNPPRP